MERGRRSGRGEDEEEQEGGEESGEVRQINVMHWDRGTLTLKRYMYMYICVSTYVSMYQL